MLINIAMLNYFLVITLFQSFVVTEFLNFIMNFIIDNIKNKTIHFHVIS